VNFVFFNVGFDPAAEEDKPPKSAKSSKNRKTQPVGRNQNHHGISAVFYADFAFFGG
jgi:hypothetical protein